MLTTLRRIFKYGFLSFLRNGSVSLATVLVMTLALFIIASSMYADAALKATLAELKKQVDINVYFVPDAELAKIKEVQSKLNSLPEVQSTKLVEAEEVLRKFKERHKDDALTIQSIEELGTNPFGAMLQIEAKSPDQYESIANYLNKIQKEQGQNSIIEKVNFTDSKGAIDALSSLIKSSKKITLVVIAFLVFVSVLIVYNTIRLAVYTNKEEISVMKLVGASDWYVQGPFIIEGALYGISAAILTLLILYPVSLWLAEPSKNFLVVFDTWTFFTENFVNIAFLLLSVGVVLGVVSSFLSVNKYLDV